MPSLQLTGIEIIVNGKPKFVGKLGLCPTNHLFPDLKGVPVFYREVPWKDVYSYTTNAIGVDANAWQRAAELGAAGMLVYCEDESKCLWITAADINGAYIVDLGEYPQRRIHPNKAKTVKAYAGIKFGWTSNVERIEPRRIETVKEEAAQMSLFGEAA